ncbi:MAG TPA: hypothetical protein VK939_02715 [Longimicrobiales bacterium]|nr:hypothetical protein [Longimicrobiales bacterium]
MVFYRSPVAADDGESREHEGGFTAGTPLDGIESIPADLLSEQGQAYLRLLTQLARCGLDAAGPPLLPESAKS